MLYVQLTTNKLNWKAICLRLQFTCSSKRIYSKISSIESALQEAGMKIKSMSKTVEDANMHEY